MLFVAMKKAYLIDFIGFIIAKTKNISHVFSMTYVASGNRWATVVKKIQSHERRITNIEDHEGIENPDKN